MDKNLPIKRTFGQCLTMKEYCEQRFFSILCNFGLKDHLEHAGHSTTVVIHLVQVNHKSNIMILITESRCGLGSTLTLKTKC